MSSRIGSWNDVRIFVGSGISGSSAGEIPHGSCNAIGRNGMRLDIEFELHLDRFEVDGAAFFARCGERPIKRLQIGKMRQQRRRFGRHLLD